jgi:hypothetical protein
VTLGATYVTSDELKGYLGQSTSDATDNTQITDALNSISREVEKYCHRQFNDAGSTSARVYYPDDYYCTEVDDFSTTTGLVVKVDTAGDGTFATTWAATDVQAEPLNGIVDGESGWPFWKLRAVGSNTFPCYWVNSRAPLQVTARWGWTAVPAPVKQACLILAAETFRLKGAPFGVAAMDQFGPIRVRDNPMAAKKLTPYVLNPVLVA